MSEVWPPTKLGDCCDILDSMRVPLNSEQRDTMQGDIPYYGANGLQGYIDKFIFDEPLILLAEDGGYFDEYETRPIAYRVKGKSWVNNHAHVLRAIAGISFCQDYIFYCLEHKNITPFIKGGTRAKLNQSELREILIPKAPEPQQCHIAEILLKLDKIIEQTEALIAKIQQVKAGLMHDLFTCGVTTDGHLRPTRERAPDLYKESPLGWIPKEWETNPVAAIAESLVDGPFGSNLKSEHYVVEPGVRVVRLQNIQEGNYNDSDPVYVSQRHADYLSRNAVNPGDVLIAALGDENYPVGRSCCYPLDLPPAINKADCFRLRCLPDVARNAYITHFFNTTSSRNQVKRFEQGVTRRRTNLGNLRRVVIALPTIDEQDRIIQRLLAVNKQIEAGESQVEKLRQQKQGLMHDLLTGRVRLSLEKTMVADNITSIPSDMEPTQ